MIIYTKNPDYKIFANTADKKFYIQMQGQDIDLNGYDIASAAIVKAEDRK